MKIHLAVGLASLVAISCGGGDGASKGASAPAATSHAPSRVSMIPTTAADKAFDVSGPAFAQYAPDMKLLVVYVFDSATSPTPDCSMLGAKGLDKLTAGTIASFTLSNYPGPTVGTFPIALSDSVRSGVPNKTVFLSGKLPDQTTLEISSYDAKTLVASAKDPQGKSVGTIDALVCPDGNPDPLQNELSVTAATGQSK
jgi:hypothetical protein